MNGIKNVGKTLFGRGVGIYIELFHEFASVTGFFSRHRVAKRQHQLANTSQQWGPPKWRVRPEGVQLLSDCRQRKVNLSEIAVRSTLNPTSLSLPPFGTAKSPAAPDGADSCACVRPTAARDTSWFTHTSGSEPPWSRSGRSAVRPPLPADDMQI